MQLLGPPCRISESSQDIRNIGRGLELIKWARLSIGRRGRRCIAFGCRSRRASWRRRNATGTKGYHNAWHRSIIACCVYQKLPANFGCSYDQRYFNSVSSKSAQDTPTFVASQAGGSSKSSASISAQFLSTPSAQSQDDKSLDHLLNLRPHHPPLLRTFLHIFIEFLPSRRMRRWGKGSDCSSRGLRPGFLLLRRPLGEFR